ncbi:DUF3857 domain-containing protein [Mucilaginibacter sp.]
MRISLISVLLLTIFCKGNAQQPYDASLIPKELIPYANAVIRNQQVNIDVKDLDNTIYHFKQVITILNKNGDDKAEVVISHDKNNIIKYIKGSVYNSFGLQVGKFSESDFEDVSNNDGFSLFDDLKIKHYRPAVTDYPYTVEYEYEERVKQSLDFDDWTPNPWLGTAVEHSEFTFICKSDFKIRYKEINLLNAANISTNKDGLKTYSWEVSNIKAMRKEPYSSNPEKFLSAVKISPEKFKYYGIQGSYADWKGLGKWIYDNLVSDRQQLPPATIQHVKDIIAGIPDVKLKAKKIYEFMQSKTHYVSVQVGIGGLQPFLARDVDQLNYGDCKALVNYTQALLKAADINSWYCVVTGDPYHKTSMLSDFASVDQGNHIILCIPFKNDTTWMDCTSETIPFGYLGSFTDDRTVLACTPNGGILLRTPKYAAETNLSHREANFSLNNDGELSGNMITNFKGIQYDAMENVIADSYSEQLKDMQKIYPINNMAIKKLVFNQDKSLNPVTTETIDLKASEYASIGNNKISFLINSVNRVEEAPKEVRNRLTDVYINEGYTEEDEITYVVPEGYHLESTPLKETRQSKFGSFSAECTMTGNQLIYKRRLQVIDGTYPKDTYQDFVDFYQTVVDADDYSVVLVKNTIN